MRLLFTISLLLLSLSPAKSIAPNIQKGQVFTDQPEVLQKAGVKKARVIFKDSHKFIWIGTENGLYRYDGSNADLLTHDADNKQSIPFNTITSITEDKEGYVWAGTLEGAARIDPYNLTCNVFNKARHNLNNDFDVKIWVDDGGRIWAGGSEGLSVFDKQEDKFRLVWDNILGKDVSSIYVTCLTDWKKDTLILGTFNGAVLINKKNFRFKRVHPAKGGFTVTSLFVDDSGKTWMGTWGNGCSIFDRNFKNYTQLKWEPTIKSQLANVITDIIATNYNRHKRLWVATSRGIYEIKGFTGNIAACKAIPVVKDPDNFVSTIYADDEQYIWEGGQLVSRFFAGDSFFKPLPVDVAGLTQEIQPINVNGQNDIALSTWYSPSGLTIFNPDDNRIVYKQPDQKTPDISNIGGIIKDKYSRFWVCTFAGLQILDSKFHTWHSTGALFTGKDSLLSHKPYSIFINHDTIWVECYKRGVNLYDLNFHKLKTFLPGDGSGLTDNLVEHFFSDDHGDVWLCGSKKLFKYDRFRGKFESYIFNQDGTTGSIQDIAGLHSGGFMVATTTGLFRFNSKTGASSKITSPLVRDNNIRSVCIDNHGDVWFINAGHLIYYQVKSRHFTLFGEEDGLHTEGDLQWLETTDGKHFYLAESKRLVFFSPDNKKQVPSPIILYLRNIQINDSTLAQSKFTTALKLKYNQNRINLEFGAINYIKPEQNEFAYQLTGVDDKWVYTPRNYASFDNLSPGTYTFKLKAENYAGLWSLPISLSVIIAPPFWRTWWFIMLVAIVIMVVVYNIYNYRLEQLLRVERLRTKISTDLHDDIGSTLSSISILSELVLNKKDKGNADEMLNEIKDNAISLMEKMDDIVWSINPRNDSLEDLLARITRFAEQVLDARNIDHDIVLQPNIKNLKLPVEARQHLYLMMKETINNIIKHACCTKASIAVTHQGHLLTVIMSDNGKGFNPNQACHGNGLINLKERAEKMNASVSIDSSSGQGAMVTISIKIK